MREEIDLTQQVLSSTHTVIADEEVVYQGVSWEEAYSIFLFNIWERRKNRITLKVEKKLFPRRGDL